MQTRYDIRVRGHLRAAWSSEFGGLQVLCEPDGTTRITGELQDQAALYGVLLRIRDLGLTLVSVNAVEPAASGPAKALGVEEHSA